MTETPKAKGRDYGRILQALQAANKPLCAFEFEGFNINPHYLDSSRPDYWIQARAYIGCTEATLARRLREAYRLGLVVASRRQAQSGAWLTAYSLPAAIPDGPGASKDVILGPIGTGTRVG